MPQRARPYIKLLRPKLEVLVRENWDDPEVLSLILAELRHRTWQGSINLRQKVEKRLIELTQENFLWPSTKVLPTRVPLSGDEYQVAKSPIKALGYTVGRSGLPRTKRRAILDRAYAGELPQVESRAYMAKWGRHKTGVRLKKMAELIASMARGNKRKKYGASQQGIQHWEEDLEYLRLTYYVGRYDGSRIESFEWPET